MALLSSDYMCSQHVHGLSPTAEAVRKDFCCDVCEDPDTDSRFFCTACAWHICLACSDQEPLLMNKHLQGDSIKFLDKSTCNTWRPGVIFSVNADGTFDISYQIYKLLQSSGDEIAHHIPGNAIRRVVSRQRKAPKRFQPFLKQKEKKAKIVRLNEDVCFCCNDGGELISCDYCPKVYVKFRIICFPVIIMPYFCV